MARMKAEDRREQLLESAAHCFARYGYRGTTTVKIAAEAGISEPIIYRHFKNKHDLFIALIEKVGKNVFQNWQEAMKQAQTPLDKLKIMLYRNPATADPWTQSVYQVLFHAATEVSEPAIQQAILDHYEHYVQSLSSIIREAQEADQIRNDVPAEWLAWQIIHAAVGFAMVRPLNIPSHASMEFVQGTISLLMELLTRKN
ncbi:MAG: TetR/AcrR family transcriptional regulator [Planctomycetota bacterium]|nr:MAG: TetR/AcrR family transcriptional regulator [Planctomycetota bacterium]